MTLTDLHGRQGRRLLSDRPRDGPCCTCPASCDARVSSRDSPRALLIPVRLDGAHEAIRADFVLFRSEDLGLASSTRPAHVLTFIARNEQPGWQATCTIRD
jgi:hypothetical protein